MTVGGAAAAPLHAKRARGSAAAASGAALRRHGAAAPAWMGSLATRRPSTTDIRLSNSARDTKRPLCTAAGGAGMRGWQGRIDGSAPNQKHLSIL